MNLRRLKRPRRAIEIEDLKRVRLEDGDTLIVKIAGIVTDDLYEQIHKSLRGQFPRNEVLIIEGDTSLAVLGKDRS